MARLYTVGRKARQIFNYLPRSYSWSANVCGRKEWLLYRPGEEENLRDSLGNLPFDVTNPELNDRLKYPNAWKAQQPIRVVQEPGEIIFVPRYRSNLSDVM